MFQRFFGDVLGFKAAKVVRASERLNGVYEGGAVAVPTIMLETELINSARVNPGFRNVREFLVFNEREEMNRVLASHGIYAEDDDTIGDADTVMDDDREGVSVVPPLDDTVSINSLKDEFMVEFNDDRSNDLSVGSTVNLLRQALVPLEDTIYSRLSNVSNEHLKLVSTLSDQYFDARLACDINACGEILDQLLPLLIGDMCIIARAREKLNTLERIKKNFIDDYVGALTGDGIGDKLPEYSVDGGNGLISDLYVRFGEFVIDVRNITVEYLFGYLGSKFNGEYRIGIKNSSGSGNSEENLSWLSPLYLIDLITSIFSVVKSVVKLVAIINVITHYASFAAYFAVSTVAGSVAHILIPAAILGAMILSLVISVSVIFWKPRSVTERFYKFIVSVVV